MFNGSIPVKFSPGGRGCLYFFFRAKISSSPEATSASVTPGTSTRCWERVLTKFQTAHSSLPVLFHFLKAAFTLASVHCRNLLTFPSEKWSALALQNVLPLGPSHPVDLNHVLFNSIFETPAGLDILFPSKSKALFETIQAVIKIL